MTTTTTMPRTTPNGTPPKDSWSIAVAEVAAIMDTPPYNTPPAKWHKALDLVRAGKVQAHEDGRYTVQGSTRLYLYCRYLSMPAGAERQVEMVQTSRGGGTLETGADTAISHEWAACAAGPGTDAGTRGCGRGCRGPGPIGAKLRE